jgi:hypothetical protein
MGFHGDHTSTCMSLRRNLGARLDGLCARPSLPHGWTHGPHPARSHGQRGPTARRREIRNYLRDQAGSRSLVFDLSVTLERFGSSGRPQQNGLHLQDLDTPLRLAAQRKIDNYRQQ